MVTFIKHEHHQVKSQFSCYIDEEILGEIYPDLSEQEITKLLKDISDSTVLVDSVIEDAFNNDVELNWDRDYDDWWTDRKGGYDVTYELGSDDGSPPFYYDE